MLVVENGTIVTGANSFVTISELETFGTARGYTFDTSTDSEVLLIKAIDYLCGKESNMKGNRVSEDQTLPYPRENVYLYGYELVPDEITDDTLQYPIPQELKNAQMQLALYLYDNVSLSPITGNNLKRKKIGPLEREYFQGGSQPYLKQLDTWLAPLMKNIGFMSVDRG